MKAMQVSYGQQRNRAVKRPLWSEAKRGTQKSGVETLSAKDKSHILLAVLLIGMVFIGVIIAGAYAASINYQNNQIRESNQALQSEVQSLHIDLESASNLANIEKRATKDLGMVYPDGDKLVVLSTAKKVDSNLAVKLKKKAFD